MARAADDPEGQKQAAAFQRGIEELGWSSGHNVAIEYRWPAGDTDRAQALTKELIDWQPDILVANSTPSLVAARQATNIIPIVFVAVADPVAQGFVQSLAHPGGKITGFGAEEPSMGAKWVQLLSEIAPRLQSITVTDHFARSQRDRTRPCHCHGGPPAIRRPDRSAGQLS
jgi:putative ABC transport system substrate-binding protein